MLKQNGILKNDEDKSPDLRQTDGPCIQLKTSTTKSIESERNADEKSTMIATALQPILTQ